jgi:arylsulfatase A-like enzyme
MDRLPTILKIAGQEIPASCEGKILPGLGGEEDPQRSVIVMDAQRSSAFKPFDIATYAIIKGNYKLHYYHGYPNKYQEFFELYDLKEDPEELHDRYDKPKFAPIIAEMKKELFKAMDEANQKLSLVT